MTLLEKHINYLPCGSMNISATHFLNSWIWGKLASHNITATTTTIIIIPPRMNNAVQHISHSYNFASFLSSLKFLLTSASSPACAWSLCCFCLFQINWANDQKSLHILRTTPDSFNSSTLFLSLMFAVHHRRADSTNTLRRMLTFNCFSKWISCVIAQHRVQQDEEKSHETENKDEWDWIWDGRSCNL